jgi:hypothetical protein
MTMSAYKCWCGRPLSSAAQCVLHGSGYERTPHDDLATLRATISRLEGERDEALARINNHNDDLIAMCNGMRAKALPYGDSCFPYTNRGRMCPDCPRTYVIDDLSDSAALQEPK